MRDVVVVGGLGIIQRNGPSKQRLSESISARLMRDSPRELQAVDMVGRHNENSPVQLLSGGEPPGPMVVKSGFDKVG
jgi:hypothetical protein